MPWLKALHLCAVIVWSGTLLYLPVLLGSANRWRSPAWNRDDALRSARLIYVAVATPVALLAIGSGSALNFTIGTVPPWLVLKLAVVGMLTLAHGACGWLLLRAEHRPDAPPDGRGRLIGLLSIGCIATIVTLVLQKPF